MQYKCGLCMVSPSREPFVDDREAVTDHLEDHGVLDVETYLTAATEQATL